MNSFEQQARGIGRDEHKTNVYTYLRSDGKYKVVYCFAARRITKILTLAALEAERASGKYEVWPK